MTNKTKDLIIVIISILLTIGGITFLILLPTPPVIIKVIIPHEPFGQQEITCGYLKQ